MTPKQNKKKRPARKKDAQIIDISSGPDGQRALGSALRTLRPTVRGVEGVEPLNGFFDAFHENLLPLKTPCNADNIRRAWATIVHIREEEEALDELKYDLDGFKAWLRNSAFLEIMNVHPIAALCWFFDIVEDQE